MNDDDLDAGCFSGTVHGSITLSGNWNQAGVEALFDQASADREVVCVMGARHIFGVEWWSERQRFRAVPTFSAARADDWTFARCDMRVVSPVVTERSEWWRRIGYAIVRRLPEWKRGTEEPDSV